MPTVSTRVKQTSKGALRRKGHSSEATHQLEHFLRSRGRELCPNKRFRIQEVRRWKILLRATFKAIPMTLFSHTWPRLHTVAVTLQSNYLRQRGKQPRQCTWRSQSEAVRFIGEKVLLITKALCSSGEADVRANTTYVKHGTKQRGKYFALKILRALECGSVAKSSAMWHSAPFLRCTLGR